MKVLQSILVFIWKLAKKYPDYAVYTVITISAAIASVVLHRMGL